MLLFHVNQLRDAYEIMLLNVVIVPNHAVIHTDMHYSKNQCQLNAFSAINMPPDPLWMCII